MYNNIIIVITHNPGSFWKSEIKVFQNQNSACKLENQATVSQITREWNPQAVSGIQMVSPLKLPGPGSFRKSSNQVTRKRNLQAVSGIQVSSLC